MTPEVREPDSRLLHDFKMLKISYCYEVSVPPLFKIRVSTMVFPCWYHHYMLTMWGVSRCLFSSEALGWRGPTQWLTCIWT